MALRGVWMGKLRHEGQVLKDDFNTLILRLRFLYASRIPTSPLYNSALPTIGGVLTREYFMRTWRNKGQGVGDKKQETGDKMQEANDETRDKRQ